MAGKKDRELQRYWEEKISRAKKVREDWAKKFQVERGREFFDGQQNVDKVSPDEFIATNKIYAHIKTILPSLYAADPYFYVRLKRCYHPAPEMRDAYEVQGRIRAAYLNYLKESLNLKSKMRVSIQDALFAYGVVKVGYSAETEDNPYAGMPMLAEDGVTLLADPDTGMPLLEPEKLLVSEKYHVTRVHPDDFIWDEDAGPLEDDWQWVGQRIVVPLEEVIEDPRFNKTAVNKLKAYMAGGNDPEDDQQKRRRERKKGDIAGTGEEDYSAFSKKGEPRKGPITYWEVYHIEEDKYSVFAENCSLPLVYMEDLPIGVMAHPYSILTFTLRDDSPYPIPPVSQSIDPQREYNDIRSRMKTHRKRFNRKYEVSGMVEDEEMSKLESGEDGTCVRTQQPGSINPIKDAPLDQATTIMEGAMIEKNITELLAGATEEARGIAGADSATQAGILEKRMEIREGDAMSMVVDFVKTIARKLDKLVETHITQQEAVKIAGPEGEFWAIVKPQDYEQIQGEYEYDINIGSIMPRLPSVERSQWMAFLALLGNFPQLLLSPRLMKHMAEMHHIEDEAMLEELMNIGKQMMSGQLPIPGQAGSQPGQSESRPQSAQGGQAGGFASLNQPGAGNIGG